MAIRCSVAIALVLGGATLWAQTPTALTEKLDTRPLVLKAADAFPQVAWEDWDSAEETGRLDPLRPMLVTHAGDGSHRVLIPTEQGVVYVVDNRRDATSASIFLDLRDRVSFEERSFEEGFLGLAFHPRYQQNGEFFVFYTNLHEPHQNVLSRFRRSASDPNKADPASEQILLTIDKPYWNHDGGTLIFGPDGYLYIAIGDGGLRDDPVLAGQRLNTLLGKIVRIDVDHTSGKLPYAIPTDNPFATGANPLTGKDDARGEIWAYGLRNVWRMSFDRQTGLLWAADVGQDLWEEIDLIQRGGNYGWNRREAMHPFGPDGVGPNPQMIEPVWEYSHGLGKSIIGGTVYRGKKIPELVGGYLYADYVVGRMWALYYDPTARRVTANREIPLPRSLAVMSFGEDEEGEPLFTFSSLTGHCVWGLYPADPTGK